MKFYSIMNGEKSIKATVMKFEYHGNRHSLYAFYVWVFLLCGFYKKEPFYCGFWVLFQNTLNVHTPIKGVFNGL